MSEQDNDPKGLIRESYRIEGITDAQCRSIFLDWALSLPEGRDTAAAITALLALYRDPWPDHPMTEILQQGLTRITTPGRRGGWRSRERGANGGAGG
ncbi:hypothetical protein [Shimia sp.]|uniref:hypothetical protein n=1 Tax=Shimia sp. TaxID=1954381 RepID=UPI003567485D